MKFSEKIREYEHLRTWTEPWGIVYGPISSRRLGQSLGVNILGVGPKACSFDCGYCELGSTSLRMKDLKSFPFPSLSEISAEITDKFRNLVSSNQKFDVISLVGNGEPTLHPEFLEIIQDLILQRTKFFPEKKIAVFTNGSTLENRKVIQALNLVDERWVKLDAGSELLMKTVNNPLIRMSVQKIISGTRKLKDVVLQCMFVQGVVDNTQLKDIEEWIEVVGMIRPKSIHLYTLDRIPALAGLKRVEEDTLDRIAAQLERRIRIRAQVIPV